MVPKATSAKTKAKADEKLAGYELIFIISPEAAEEKLDAVIDNVSGFITGKGGIISDVEQWGKRRLAYPIKHFQEGSYVLTRCQLQPGQNRELGVNLKNSEDVLRHLLIRLNQD